jgi:hypothetical protein
MRDDAGRKGETFFLGGSIDRSQQATACEATSPRFRVDCDLAHFRQIDHHSVIASAEPGEAVPSTTYGREDSSGRSRPDRSLHVSSVTTTGNQARTARHHAVPNPSRKFVVRIIGTQQVAADFLPQGTVDFTRRCPHVFCFWRHAGIYFRPPVRHIPPVVLHWLINADL